MSLVSLCPIVNRKWSGDLRQNDLTADIRQLVCCEQLRCALSASLSSLKHECWVDLGFSIDLAYIRTLCIKMRLQLSFVNITKPSEIFHN